MNYGFTTWPERQFYWDEMEGLTNSLNHPMHSGFAAYFYESMGGIKSSYNKPGYKEFTVNPIAPKSIIQTSVKVPTNYGVINNSWEKTTSGFSMNLTVPFNTKASVLIPIEALKSLKINDVKWIDFQKNNNTETTNKPLVILGSGNYQIEFNNGGI